MTNLIVASYQQEDQANAASKKLSELEVLGDITIYDRVVIKKDLKGEIEVLDAHTSDGLRTLTGMAVGTFVGALAGPVGMVAGMISGTLGGALWESDYFGFSEDFGSKVSSKMLPGTVAVIAEVEEENVVFVDSTLAPLGGQLFRSLVDYEYGKYDEEQIEDIDEEIATETASLKAAAAAEKTKIQAKISDLKEKRRQKIAELEKKAKEAVAKGKVQMESLGEKFKAPLEELMISRLKGRIQRHQTRLAELQSELKKIES